VLKNYPDWALSCDRQQILKTLEDLPLHGRYAFNYYLSSRCAELEYQNPIEDIFYFDITDMKNIEGKGNSNKKFFPPKTLYGLDHGNHYGKVEGLLQTECLETNLCL